MTRRWPYLLSLTVLVAAAIIVLFTTQRRDNNPTVALPTPVATTVTPILPTPTEIPRVPAVKNGSEEASLEYQIKAAILFNIVKFINWPGRESAETKDRFVIGIVGKDLFGTALDEACKDRKIQGKLIQVIRCADDEEARKCDLVFISSSKSAELSEILPTLRGFPVLTVGDCEGFAKQGGMIEFKIIDNRVKFELNARAGEQEGLDFNQTLKQIAVPPVE